MSRLLGSGRIVMLKPEHLCSLIPPSPLVSSTPHHQHLLLSLFIYHGFSCFLLFGDWLSSASWPPSVDVHFVLNSNYWTGLWMYGVDPHVDSGLRIRTKDLVFLDAGLCFDDSEGGWVVRLFLSRSMSLFYCGFLCFLSFILLLPSSALTLTWPRLCSPAPDTHSSHAPVQLQPIN